MLNNVLGVFGVNHAVVGKSNLSVRQVVGLVFLVLLLAGSWTSSLFAAVDSSGLLDLGQNVAVEYTRFRTNRRTGKTVATATVTNLSDQSYSGPIYLVINGITPNTVTIEGEDDRTILGEPVFIKDVAELAPGASVEYSITFVAGARLPRLSINEAVFATDAAGGGGNGGGSVPLAVSFSSPPDGLLTQADHILVEGQVELSSATVVVNGRIASVDSNGVFQVEVPLREGVNTLIATAEAGGRIGTGSVQVIRDTDPPMVVVETPREGAVLTGLQVDVAGLVNDIVTGTTINADDCEVTVNGVAAQVSNRSWVVPDLLLQRGLNTLTIVATDRAGNSRVVSRQVRVADQVGQRIVLLAGNNQVAAMGSSLPEPLAVGLLDADGNPVPDKAVTFRVSRGDGILGVPPEQDTKLVVRTDDNGIASTFFTIGERIGSGNHRVIASAPGFVGEVEFCALAIAGVPRRITTVSGDGQTGIAEETLPKPFVVLVTDAGGNPVGGVDVTFEVKNGLGSFGGAPSVVSTTDSDGLASATMTLGPQSGINNNIAEASFAGLMESPASFRASGRAVGRPADTTISGIVLDNQDNPIPGATVHVESLSGSPGAPAGTAVTDDQGRFSISNAPVGTVHLVVDASTTTRTGHWLAVGFEMTTIAGQDNTLGHPIWLLPVAENEVVVQSGGPEQEITLSIPNVPGSKIVIAPHSVTCPNGQSQCTISWTQVRGERVPMPPPQGSSFMLAATLQPTNTRFDPPVALCIPNSSMLPGSQADMYSFDHDLGEFVAIGTATVTDDGSQLCSDPGFGIVKAGWHGCAPPPPPNKCKRNCPTLNPDECQEVQSAECPACPTLVSKPPDTVKSEQSSPSDCVTDTCGGTIPKDETVELQKENPCKLCDGGSIADVPNDLEKHCGDGSSKQACLICKDGLCTRPDCPVDASDDVSVRLSEGVAGEWASKARSLLNRIPGVNIKKVSLEVRADLIHGQRCCKDCELADPVSDYIRGRGSINSELTVHIAGPRPKNFEKTLAYKGYGIRLRGRIDTVGWSLDFSLVGNGGLQGQVMIKCPEEQCVALAVTGGASLRPKFGLDVKDFGADVVWRGENKQIFSLDITATAGARVANTSVRLLKGLHGDNCPEECRYTLGAMTVDAKLNAKLSIFGHKLINPPAFTIVFVVWNGFSGTCL